MPSLPSKILIFGATGAIGKYITDAILSAKPSKRQGLRVVTGDINNTNDVSRAYDGVDVVVSCLGRNALAAQIELIRLTEESTSGERTHQNKLKVREFIRNGIKRLKYTYLVTGPYVDMYLNFVPGAEALGGYDVSSRRAVVIGSGNDAVGFTSMPDVGKLVVATLRIREGWTIDHTSNQELHQLEKQLWNNNNPLAAAATLRRIWAEGRTLYEMTDNERLGLAPEDMETLATVVGRVVSEARQQ
ncbi:NAD(P)-binding protein [Xylariaceae sp. AK1471]|nr:NAD(P)-binding protein [Xylariaceae sp. AK1471]